MLMKTIILIVVLLWVYSLSVFKRAKLDAFYFLMGSLGLFIILVLWSKPYAVWLFSTIMTWGVGLVGDFFGTFSTLPLGHVIQVLYHERIILMNVDYECSGIVETAAFVSLISFYPVFKVQQRLWLALAGVAFIFIANIVRLTFVSTSLHLFGSDSFFLAHSILGRLLFYVLMLTFYFTIFTRGQLIQVASQNRETV